MATPTRQRILLSREEQLQLWLEKKKKTMVWSCPTCTFDNENDTASICCVCGLSRRGPTIHHRKTKNQQRKDDDNDDSIIDLTTNEEHHDDSRSSGTHFHSNSSSVPSRNVNRKRKASSSLSTTAASNPDRNLKKARTEKIPKPS